MPTRVVGTCCCGPPSFGWALQFWVLIEETYDRYGEFESSTITPLGSIPASYQRTCFYKSDFYGDSSLTDTIQTTTDYNRYSLFGVTYGSQNGGSLDPDAWVAFETEMTDETFVQCDINGTTIRPEPIDYRTVGQKYFKLTSDWTRIFTYGNTTYRFTVPAGVVFAHDTPYHSIFHYGPYEVYTAWDNDDDNWISKTLYARFVLMRNNGETFERVQQQ